MFNDITMLRAEQATVLAPMGLAEALSDALVTHGSESDSVGSAAFKLPKGEWFDEGFDFREPEGEVFIKAALEMIDAVEVRDRARRPVDEANHRTIVRKLLANGFRAFHYYQPSLVACQRKASAYKGRAGWLNGEAMKRVTDLLREAGLINFTRGEHGAASSTYRVTETFLFAAFESGITDKSLIYRLPAERLVRLYRTNGKDGEAVDYEQSDQSRQWHSQLSDFNDYIADQDISISFTLAEATKLTARMNSVKERGLPLLMRPELIKTNLYRQFNNASFEVGGRLYGGWWINCPKDLRPLITINGERTVELDYSGCAIRMLYHERNEECEGDPYLLDTIDACERNNGLGRGYFRDDVKRMTQALINGREGGHGERVKLDHDHSFKPYYARGQVMAMIREKHAPIADTFQTGAWGRLQRAESDIALEVITNLKAKGIVALPLHDSFIVIEGNEHDLKKEMIDCYLNRIGYKPVIK